jgi:hypothetical protein
MSPTSRAIWLNPRMRGLADSVIGHSFARKVGGRAV